MREPRMNMTVGSMKSRKASPALRMPKSGWKTPMARLVTPIGITSKTHQTPARRNRPMAAWPACGSSKTFPEGSIAGLS
jgi:hypothetical protein